MFFESEGQIPEIAKKTGFSIFVIEEIPNFPTKNTLKISPDEKTNKIPIESVREFLKYTVSKKTTDSFFVVEYPEKMTIEAENAFLKNLEEPKENYHFVFLTKDLSSLPKTVLSRAQIYIKKITNPLEKPILTNEKIKSFAKRLLTVKSIDLPSLMREMTDKKDREFVMSVVECAIEMAYKTYFLKKDTRFLEKIPNLLNLHKNLSLNGNIKLHIVADML